MAVMRRVARAAGAFQAAMPLCCIQHTFTSPKEMWAKLLFLVGGLRD